MTGFDMDLLRALAAALGVGILIGIERGWSQREAVDGGRVSGLRTFGLLGLAGGIAARVPQTLGLVMGLGVVAALVLGYRGELVQRTSLSVTNTLAGIMTFVLGYLAGEGLVSEALAVAAVVTLVLASRERAHAMLKGLERKEVEAIARFAIVALVVLPLLPDAGYGPFDAWNPRQIWMVVVVVLGLSFAGYVVGRRFGADKGIVITALFGALVSSTAVTLAYARRLHTGDGPAGALIAGIGIASLVMFARVQVLAILLVPYTSASLALAMTPGFVVGGAVTWLAARSGGGTGAGGQGEAIALSNPLDFRPALLLAGAVAIVAIPARWALERFGDEGIVVVLGLTGMWDVDAAVLTLAGLPMDLMEPDQAGLLLAVPVLANTAVKGVLAFALAGGTMLRWRAAGPLFASIAASLAGIALLLWLK